MATYIISGTSTDDCRVRVFSETDEEYIGYKDITVGNYEVKFRLNSQQPMIAVGEKSDGESKAFGQILPHLSAGAPTLTPPEHWDEKSGNFTASNGDRLLLDSSVAGFMVTMPGSPLMGDTVSFIDAAGGCELNNVTISGSGEKIMGSSQNFIIEENNASFDLIYYNSTYGWRLKHE